jgi:propionyl-CoA synthetase
MIIFKLFYSFRNLFLAGEHCDYDTLKWASNVMKCPVLDHWWQTG